MKLRTLGLWAALSIPLVIFYSLHAYWVTNTPMQDDFDGIIRPTTEWMSQKLSFSNVWSIISAQDDERRVFANRFMAIILTEIQGYLDLRTMKTVGLLFNLVLFGLIIQMILRRGWSAWTLAPVALVLFSQANYNALHWAMIPVQQIGVFVWGITALWCLSRGNYILAGVFGILSLGSDVTGVLIWPAGILTLCLIRHFKGAAGWAVVMGAAVWAYMNGLVVPSYRPSLADNLQAWPDLIGMLWIFPALFLDVFIDTSPSLRIILLLCIATGIWLIFGRLAFQRILTWFGGESLSAHESWLWGSIAFLSATSVIFSLGRASEGMEVILDSRYRHIYHLIAIFLWLIALFHFQMNRWIKPMTGFMTIWYVWIIYVTWGYFDFNRQVQLTDMYAWHQQRSMPSTGIYLSLRQEVDQVIERAQSVGVYRPADFLFAKLTSLSAQGQKVARWVNVNPQGMGVEIEDVPRGNGKNDGTYVVLKSTSTDYILPVRQLRSSSWLGFLPGRYYQPIGHSIFIQHQMIQAGTYKVLVGQHRDGTWRMYDTNLIYEPTLPAGS